MRIVTKLIFAIALVFFLWLSAPAQIPGFSGAVWDTLTHDAIRDNLSQQPLASWQDHFFLTYAKSRAPMPGWDIIYRTFNANTGWSAERPVLVDTPGYEPVIAVKHFPLTDTTRIAALVFTGGNRVYGTLIYDTTTTIHAVLLTSIGQNDFFPGVDVDSAGNMQVAWVTQMPDNTFKVAYGSGRPASFTRETITNSELGTGVDGVDPIVVTTGVLPHVFYRGLNDGYYHIHHAYKQTTGGPWIIEFLATGNLQDVRASAFVDNANNIHLAVTGNDGDGTQYRIYHLDRDAQTGLWSTPQLATGILNATDGNIAVSPTNQMFIVSAGLDNNLFNGQIYLSTDTANVFNTTPIASNYPQASMPAIRFINNINPGLVFQTFIGSPDSGSFEIVFYGPALVGVNEDIKLPEQAELTYNYPNPFNAETMIMVKGFNAVQPKLEIYDITGRKVRSLQPQESANGDFQYLWNGTNESGIVCPSGVYFYSVNGPTRNLMGKMTLMK